MTNQELNFFLQENNIKVGDRVRIDYSYMCNQSYLRKEVVSTTLMKGNTTVSTSYGKLQLPRDEYYFILYSEMDGLTGITAQYIVSIESDGYGPMTSEEYYKFIEQNEIKAGDLVSLVMIDNMILPNIKLLEKELFMDVDRDTLLLVQLPNGTRETMLLNKIGRIDKLNKSSTF